MTTYRIIVELVYAMPSEQFLSQYREFWALAFSIAVFFATRDLAILFSFMSTEEKLARKYALNFGNFIVSYCNVIDFNFHLPIRMLKEANVEI